MSKTRNAAPEKMPTSELTAEQELAKGPSAGIRRTRSGRTVRAPASLQDPTTEVKTPTRRTRRSVLRELPTLDETNNEDGKQKSESPIELEKTSVCELEPIPELKADTADVQNDEEVVMEVKCRSAEKEMLPANSDKAPNKKPRLDPAVKQVPLGKPKSGRVWKDRNKQRFSAVVRDKQLCTSWEKKMQDKREKELVKRYTRQLKEEKAKQKEDKRKRREENLKRRAENERKAEIVQVIRNTSKIKRMKKKQLRRIEKRDTLALVQKPQNKNQNTKSKTQKNTKGDLGPDLT